ncbi:MAG: NAD-dependent epimerase/dehydratase family protein [Phycisphaerales bacterium]|nr:NAD-dependent epimerase/dehydratase family protein [Phycisphaerales bacterium]
MKTCGGNGEAIMDSNLSAVICGGGGFIGGHLAGDLIRKGFRRVRVVDIKPLDQWYQVHPEAENIQADLNERSAAFAAVKGMDLVWNLACNMGGMGFIEKNKGLCMISVLINTHLLVAAREYGVKRYFYASSACVYNADKQKEKKLDVFLKEEDAYPAMPEDGYGWEKLFSERMCRHFREDWNVPTRVARFHNVYGPYGTWDGGREKAPAAICRKVIRAKLEGRHEIEIWGDGQQTRSFMYITDCLHGIHLITDSETWHDPINLGSAEGVTINQLVDIVEEIAGIRLKRIYNLDAPKGVNGRNSDNTLIRKVFGWEPRTPLRQGMEETYKWIYGEIINRRKSF